MKITPLVKTLFVILILATSAAFSYAGTINQYGGVYGSWPADGTWTVITSLNDPDDSIVDDGHLDFVGDAIDPGAYIAVDANYVYIRLRVDIGTVTSTTYEDSIFVFIDQVGYGTETDYAVAWDTKGPVKIEHGMEFMVDDPTASDTSWSEVKMNDIDGEVGQKIAPPDFRTAAGDGYIRTIDSISTTNFDTTSYIDFAVSWSYLNTNSTLDPGQTWRIQFGSIAAATDHNKITYDVAGGTNPITLGLDWSDPIILNDPPVVFSEPRMAMAGVFMAALAEFFKRFRRRQKQLTA